MSTPDRRRTSIFLSLDSSFLIDSLDMALLGPVVDGPADGPADGPDTDDGGSVADISATDASTRDFSVSVVFSVSVSGADVVVILAAPASAAATVRATVESLLTVA
mmetsp:Transcript_14401/g.16353  ORF Transcript_14401/g.16353 Transcript_14401/m.16353 type:complete len:106 (+) Transcript_14401:846-1163(+)